MSGLFNVMIIIIPVIALCVFIFAVANFLSPKLRGKMLGKQFKAMKSMLDGTKDDLSDIAGIAIDIRKKVVDENEEALRDLKTKEANISKDSIEITAKAIKDGFSDNKVYCKYCGALIDEDSKFCKKCGKEQ